MLRAERVAAAGEAADVIDSVTLDHEARQHRRLRTATNGGQDLFIDLGTGAHLHPGDRLVLADGTAVRVEGAVEQLLDILPGEGITLARLAWHLGNRHTPTEVRDGSLRIRADHVLAGMLVGLGAEVREVAAVFEPESGAYAHGHAVAH